VDSIEINLRFFIGRKSNFSSLDIFIDDIYYFRYISVNSEL